MLINKDENKVAALTLRYSLYLLPIGPMAVYTGMTTYLFAIDSTIVNLWMIYVSYQFYKSKKSTDARKTFFATLQYILILFLLLFIHKKEWKLFNFEDYPSIPQQ